MPGIFKSCYPLTNTVLLRDICWHFWANVGNLGYLLAFVDKCGNPEIGRR